jgi:hypothetical protein
MPTINQLSAVDQINDGDQFPLYSPNAGDARKASFTTVKESLADDFASLADLAAQTGAGLVGTSNGTTVQQALDSKPTATLDTDGTLAANSDGRVASQKATKTYADAKSTALAASSGSSLVGFLQSGTGAVARTVQSKLRDSVSVFDFLTTAEIADVTSDTGSIDLTAKIQAAINSLQTAGGGTLIFPNGTYYITSTLVIGDGTSIAPDNDLAPVALEGVGPVSGVGYGAPSNCAIIKSNVAGPAITFNGNLGWGLRRFAFTFTTASASAQAAALYNVESGDMEDITVLNCPGLVHILFYSWGTKNVTLNRVRNVFVYMDTSPANAAAIKLDGLASGSNDVALNTFEDIHVQPGVASHVGLYLGHCDTNTFIRYTFNPRVGFLPAKAVVFDYTAHTGNLFPNFNNFFGGTPYVSTIESIGSPAFHPSMANVWYGFDLANNAPVPTALGFTVDRLKLGANATFYVNPGAASGSFGPGDSTSFGVYIGRPCSSVQQAYDQIARYFDLNGYTATISCANATYSAGLNAATPTIGGRVIVAGQGGGTVFSVAGTCFTAGPGTDIEIQSVNLTSSGANCARADRGVLRVGSGAVFGSAAGDHIQADNRGTVILSGGYFIIGGGASHLNAENCGVIEGGVTCTLLGNVTIADFAKASRNGVVDAAGGTYSLGAFSVTGTRYSATLNGVLFTNGAGANFFPGNVAGTTATGGQYA